MVWNHVTRAFLLVALGGVLGRGLHRRCRTMVVYLVAVIVCGALMAYWPERYYTWSFWLLTRDLYPCLKVLVAIEVGSHVFRAFPRVEYQARVAILFLVSVLAVAFASGVPALGGFKPWHVAQAQWNAVTIWLFAAPALLVVWYNLPLDRWNAALMTGFTVQLVAAFAVSSSESAFRTYAALVDPVIASWWAYAAWRPAVVGESAHARQRVVVEGEASAG